MDSRAVEEGVDAYCVGLPRHACPYAAGSAEYLDWMRGWDEAREIDLEQPDEPH
jgi:ribosome modulation factor